jgi:PRC-barrel domain
MMMMAVEDAWNRVRALRVDKIIVVHPMRGDMRRHSRWAVAAVAAVLAFALASPANARTHGRAHGNSHPAAATTSPPQMPSAGMRSSEEAMAPPPAVADTGKGGIWAAALDPRDIETILGKSVRSNAGEDMGRLVDVVVDREGRPRAAIIDFGGFLGVGSRKIAVDWGVLKFLHDNTKGDLIMVELTRDQVKAAPEFKDGNPVVVLGPPGGTEPSPVPQPQAQDK